MWHRDMNWVNAVGRNGADRLAQCRVATNLQSAKNVVSAKHNKTKHSKMRYASIVSDKNNMKDWRKRLD